MTVWEQYQEDLKVIEASDHTHKEKLALRSELLYQATITSTLDRIDKRRKDAKVIGTYGITFLDDCLKGIMPEDFVLIGADTGVGKSEIAYNIAFENSLDKKVHLLALECDEDEPFMRKQYNYISKRYYDEFQESISYSDYRVRSDETVSNRIDSFVEEARKDMYKYRNLTIHYRQKEFGIEHLVECLGEISLDCELLIIDHVDYFDLNIEKNENMQVSNIMKVLRNINLSLRIPIIVISHLRKRGANAPIVPSIDDFMGTSNKAKQAKTVILFSREYSEDDYSACKYGTFIQVAKSRVQTFGNLIGRVQFNGVSREYEKKYLLGRILRGGIDVDPLDHDKYPRWVKKEHRDIQEESYR